MRIQSDIYPSRRYVAQFKGLATLLTLTDEEPDPNTRHVEPVQPRLDVEPDLASLLAALPLEDALGDGGHRRVVALLDVFESLCERAVVLAHLGRPLGHM